MMAMPWRRPPPVLAPGPGPRPSEIKDLGPKQLEWCREKIRNFRIHKEAADRALGDTAESRGRT